MRRPQPKRGISRPRLRADPPAPLGRVLRGRRLSGFESRPFRKRLCGCGRGWRRMGLVGADCVWAPGGSGAGGPGDSWRGRGGRGRGLRWRHCSPGGGSQVRESAPRAPTRRLLRVVLPRDPERAQGRRGSALGSQKVRLGDGGSLRGPCASIYLSNPWTDLPLLLSGRPRPAPPASWNHSLTPPLPAKIRAEKTRTKTSPAVTSLPPRAPAHWIAAPHPGGRPPLQPP